MAYLNGDDEAATINGKGKLKKKVKALSEKAKKRHKKIIEKQKALAKKLGRGLKRFARISKGMQQKRFIFALEHNFLKLATRLKAEYMKHPDEVKKHLSQFGDVQKFIAAINKGEKRGATISGEENTEKYAEYAKQGVGIIKKIIEWFKKRKKGKETAEDKAQAAEDDKQVQAMENSVDADKNIEKVDEKGQTLPASPDAEEHEHSKEDSAAKGSGESTPFYKNPMMLGAVAVAAVGIYLVTKKKK